MSFEGPGQTSSVKSPMQPIRRSRREGDTFQETGWSYPGGSVPDPLTAVTDKQDTNENDR